MLISYFRDDSDPLEAEKSNLKDNVDSKVMNGISISKYGKLFH